VIQPRIGFHLYQDAFFGLGRTLSRIWTAAGEARVTLRTAAFTLACRRILEARHLRGLYP